MHSDPKREAQMTEDHGLLGEPLEAPSVAKPDVRGEEGIETAQAIAEKEREREEQKQQQQQQQVNITEKKVPPATPSRQDRLDRERAAGEGMGPPPSNP